MSFVQGLKCRECAREYPKEVLFVCEYCFGSLEVKYDYAAIARGHSRASVEKGPASLWRYKALLPVDGEPTAGLESGFTPLIRARGLEKALNMREVWIKDDTVSHPSLSFKDRVVSVALTKAREFGFKTVACASTGNLAHSVSAQGAIAGFKRFIFIPADLEPSKVIASLVYKPNVVAVSGTYDEVNRLCAEIASKYRWGFVNINLRPYYAEGSKTFGFEVAEQLGWRLPDNIVVPVAGGSLIAKIRKSFKELADLGWVEKKPCRIHAAQALGCNPVVAAIKAGSEIIKPVKPKTIAKSLAIGNPADGYYAYDTVRSTGGRAEDATDEEIVAGMKLLAETEGVFAETAGGVTMASALKLIETGAIGREESLVLAITGNGLKTPDCLFGATEQPVGIQATLTDFETKVLSSKRMEVCT